ncbi:MAG: hypothetical protein ACLTSX_11245 [Collinsella sp.]
MPNETWTIKRCLDWTRDYLRDQGDERPRLCRGMVAFGGDGAVPHGDLRELR